MYMYMYMHTVKVYTLCMVICANVHIQSGGMEVAEAMLPDKANQLHGDGTFLRHTCIATESG